MFTTSKAAHGSHCVLTTSKAAHGIDRFLLLCVFLRIEDNIPHNRFLSDVVFQARS